jgi:hypothetical protein
MVMKSSDLSALASNLAYFVQDPQRRRGLPDLRKDAPWGGTVKLDLIVIYTERLEECRAFYAGVGVPFVAERHGGGPGHHAAIMENGTVFELYPASGSRSATGRLRLGLTVSRDAAGGRLAPGGHVLTDPDGRVLDLLVAEGSDRPADGLSG